MSPPDKELEIAIALAFVFLNKMEPTEEPGVYPVDDKNVAALAEILLTVKAIHPSYRDQS